MNKECAKKFSDLVKSYLKDGYDINVETSIGIIFGELYSIDLTNGKNIIRLSIRYEFKDNSIRGYGLYMRTFDYTNKPILWNTQCKICTQLGFYEDCEEK